MSDGDQHWIAYYIWGIADDILRDLYVRGKYRDVILPMIELRRLDAVREDSKRNVIEMKTVLDQAGVVEQHPALRPGGGTRPLLHLEVHSARPARPDQQTGYYGRVAHG